MADPLSIRSASVLSVVASIKSTKSLYAAVEHYNGRDQTLERLQGELENLINVLGSLREVVESGTPIPRLAKAAIERCSQVCREFEDAMGMWYTKPVLGRRDWAKMKFLGIDIDFFIDTLAGYRSTIIIGLSDITMLVAHTCVPSRPRIDLLVGGTPYLVKKTSKSTIT